ncbi:MAG: UDP-N-acetylmuramoyl-tripeptide--D-alanyl-D-alanine ligase [Rikenellaceae bacterium]
MDIDRLYNLFRASRGVTTDSRRIQSGSIFFALRGDNFDGNSYANDAIAMGASYAVVDSLEVCGEGIIYVDSVLDTLQQLAREHRRRLPIEIIAITGSNGKTTTKELLSEVLSCKYRLQATVGNLNNHIGVPLTLLSFSEQTEIGVVEMGASSCGEIAALCAIAEPNYGVITNIGNAHLDGFGGVEGVRRGKGELFDYLERCGGEIFVAEENGEVIGICRGRDLLKISRYSYSVAEGVESNLEGSYNRYNIATAMAIGDRFGVDRGCALEAIAQYQPTNNRSQNIETVYNRVIVDCYNANPSSMEVALANFATFTHEAKVAILGDMYELGEWSEGEHLRILQLAIGCGAERIILVGKAFAAAAAAVCGGNIECYRDRVELAERLAKEQIERKKILLKGSRGVGLEQIIKYL